MKKALGIVSTNYHLLVFLFLRETQLKEYGQVDLVVTDKTPYMEELYRKGAFHKIFRNVFFADGRKIKNPYKNAFVTLYESFIYNKTTAQIMEKTTRLSDNTLVKEENVKLESYDDVYFASPGMPDEIVKEIGKTLIKKNKKVSFHRYEDGFASYTKSPVHFINTELGKKLYKLLFRYDIEQKEKEIFLFEPYLAEEDIAFEKIRISKGKKEIEKVIEMAKETLAFKSEPFPEKFVFLGQGSQNVMNNPQTYQRLILKIKDAVGFDNMIIKPHPRGYYDDLKGEVKVYGDKCPFELAVANGDMEGKVLISYYSTACVSAKLLFESNCTIIFLNKLAGDSFNERCDYEAYFKKVTELFENVYVPKSEEELFQLLLSYAQQPQ